MEFDCICEKVDDHWWGAFGLDMNGTMQWFPVPPSEEKVVAAGASIRALHKVCLECGYAQVRWVHKRDRKRLPAELTIPVAYLRAEMVTAMMPYALENFGEVVSEAEARYPGSKTAKAFREAYEGRDPLDRDEADREEKLLAAFGG